MKNRSVFKIGLIILLGIFFIFKEKLNYPYNLILIGAIGVILIFYLIYKYQQIDNRNKMKYQLKILIAAILTTIGIFIYYLRKTF